MGGSGWLAVFCAQVLGTATVSNPVPAPGADRVEIASSATADTVRAALRGAERRLGEARCQNVLADFKDGSGRPLRVVLEELGQTPDGYLGHIHFVDASSHPLCESKRALALATPGSRVVRICPESFRARYRHDPRYVEAILIHEALHTLGLGENPPSSFEITSRVLRNCAP